MTSFDIFQGHLQVSSHCSI